MQEIQEVTADQDIDTLTLILTQAMQDDILLEEILDIDIHQVIMSAHLH